MGWSMLTSGQDYVVTLKSDTLLGRVKIMAYDLIDRIQVNDGKKKQHFTAIQVRLAVVGKETFQPVRIENGYQMMQLVNPGFLALYLARRPNSLSYEIQYLVKRDGSAMEVPNLSFRKNVSEFLKECLTVSQKIDNGELTRKNLSQIIVEYNTCLDNQAKSIVDKTPVDADDARLLALTALKKKVEGIQMPSQKDALDLLNDIREKVRNKQTVPNYLMESLKGMLKDIPECQAELEKVLGTLKG